MHKSETEQYKLGMEGYAIFFRIHPGKTMRSFRSLMSCTCCFFMLGRESRWRRGMEAKLWISSTCSTGQKRPWWRPSASRTLTGGCAASTAQRTAKVEYSNNRPSDRFKQQTLHLSIRNFQSGGKNMYIYLLSSSNQYWNLLLDVLKLLRWKISCIL